MNPDEFGFNPTLTFLSEEDKKKLHGGVLRLLEETGMALQHEEALKLLGRAGADVDDPEHVKIPSKLVEQALKSAPHNIPVYNREGELAMDLGGRRAYYGTGSDLMSHVDAKTLERHRTTIEDIRRSALVCDALPNIDFIMSFAHPHEVDPHRSYLESFRAMLEYSVKPIVNTAENRRDLEKMWEVSAVLRGGEQQLRDQPYTIQYDEPISPLKHPFTSVDKLIFCARKGMPVIYSPAPIAGSTAPITIAGHVLQGLAESFFGLVVHQLAAEGAPFLMGIGPAVLDMSTGQCSYNAPEYLLSLATMVEMTKYYDLPNWGYAGTSDSQIPDMQASFEGGLLTFISALTGSNLNHDVGYIDFGLTGSLEWIVIMDEIISQIRRIQKGVPITEETMALPVIAEAGKTGHFLTHPHSLKHLRSVQWRPKLMNRLGYEKWTKLGGVGLLEKAGRRVDEILAGYQVKPLDPSAAQEIQALCAAFTGLEK
ncbi:MAG: trimethylamine methyltransferase family protein [Pseudomonadota bacterium]